MGQKVNPIAVRIRSRTRNYDSSWFSDYYYTTLLYEDIDVRAYLNSIKAPTGKRLVRVAPGRCIIHHYPKKTLVHLFCLSKGRKRQRKRPFGYATPALSPATRFAGKGFAAAASLRPPTIQALPIMQLKSLRDAHQKSIYQAARLRRATLASAVQLQEKTSLSRQVSPGIENAGYAHYALLLARSVSPGKDSYTEKIATRDSFSKMNQLLRSWEALSLGSPLSMGIEGFGPLHGLLFGVGKKHSASELLEHTSLAAQDRKDYAKYALMSYLFSIRTHVYTIPFSQFADMSLGQGRALSGATAIPQSNAAYFSHIESVISNKHNTLTYCAPIKVPSIYQSACLVAQEIASKLQRKISFRQICKSIFRQIGTCKYIKGIRISCSGRLQGAEIANSECKKYGESSLHVFSDQIDYANARASTRYGIIGVKVWISYCQNRSTTPL